MPFSLSEKIKWHKPILPDTSETYIRWIACKENIVVSVTIKNSFENCVVARNTSNGDIIWQWGDPDLQSAENINSLDIFQNKVLIGAWGDLYLLELNTGQLIWKGRVSSTGLCGTPRVTIIGDYIYFTSQDCSTPSKFSRISRTPITNYAPEIIYQEHLQLAPAADSGWVNNLEPPSLWVKQNGDSILLFQNRAYRLGVTHNRIDLLAYNLSNRAIEWKLDSFVKEGYSSVQTPVVEENVIYYAGMYTLFKISPYNGTVIWERSFPGAQEIFAFCNFMVEDNFIYCQPGSNTFYALKKEDGSIAWQIDDVSCCGMTGSFNRIENSLYYIGSPFFISIDLEGKSLIQKDRSPLNAPGQSSNNFVSYTRMTATKDQSLLLTYDNHFIMAIEP